MGKITGQATASTRASFMFNRNLKNRFHRRDSPYLFVEDMATTLQDQPAQNFVAQVTRWSGRTASSTRASAGCGATSRAAIRRAPPTSRCATPCATPGSTPPRSSRSTPTTATRPTATTATSCPACSAAPTTSRPACSFRGSAWRYDRLRNGDILLEMRDGVPFQAQISNTPIVSDHKMETWGAFLQDRWVIGRATINVGVRLDGASGYLPEQSSPAGRLRRRALVRRDRHLRLLDEHRAAPRDLVRRLRQRPDGDQGLLRPLLQPVRLGDRRDDQPQRAGHAERGVDRQQQQPPARHR